MRARLLVLQELGFNFLSSVATRLSYSQVTLSFRTELKVVLMRLQISFSVFVFFVADNSKILASANRQI